MQASMDFATQGPFNKMKAKKTQKVTTTPFLDTFF
jgi:hypothetical protein